MEMISDDLVKTLQSLFSWRNEAYGLESSPCPITIREPLTDSLITDHLKGSKRIGVFLTGIDNRIKSTCLNLNECNPVKLRKLLVVLIERGIIPYVERSKSKGYHVWIFLSNSIEALTVRKVLSQILRSEGIDGIEILPKEDSINPNNGLGDYIFLPLHGESVKQGKTIF
jgi:hypothetical protein